MDRAMILEHLELAQRHVAEGERHVARQKEIVAELANDAHGTTATRALLIQFEEMQAPHVADRDRLRAELAALG
jgi:hypothetical protein